MAYGRDGTVAQGNGQHHSSGGLAANLDRRSQARLLERRAAGRARIGRVAPWVLTVIAARA